MGQLTYIDDHIKAETDALNENLPTLTNNFAALLLHYLQKKHEIEPSSYWFPRRRIHKQWFFAGDTATSMALETGLQIEPDEKPDLNWFEEEITARLRGHIELAFNKGDYELALNLLARLTSLAEQLSEDGEGAQ